ncbi:MAG: DHH family phosphoesterase [Bacilli bacterium]|nr:DHH family phosphoesterase [Bacilli bacterium]
MDYELIAPVQKGRTRIETILRNRGIDDIEHYLNTTDADILSPTLLANMDNGIEMLIRHIKNNDKIYVLADEDCDGYTSTATLINYLHRLFPSYVETNLSYGVHEKKTHGIVIKDIPSDIGLLIVPDASSNEYDIHKHFYDLGIDILILDHHEAPELSSYACVINNQLCDYPNKAYSGVGIVYKFCCRIDEILGTEYAKDYRDMVALGLLADMMDCRNYETAETIRQGISNIRNPFFLEMLNRNKSRFETGITAINIAFYIVPYINATSRVGSREDRLLLLEGMIEYKAEELVPSTKRGHKGEFERLVEQSARVCSNLKTTKQANLLTIGYDFAEGCIRENNLLDDKFLIVQMTSGIVPSDINGLIANKLMSKYQRPVMVLQKYGDSWGGSGRGYEKGGLKSFREFLLNSGYVKSAMGHANAFGVIIDDDKIEPLKEYAKEALKYIDFSPNYKVDFIWDIDMINENDIYEIADFNYLWAQDVDEPLVAIENIRINNETIKFLGSGGNTLRISVNDIGFLKFNLKPEEKAVLDPGSGCYVMDIVGRCARNIFNNTTSP